MSDKRFTEDEIRAAMGQVGLHESAIWGAFIDEHNEKVLAELTPPPEIGPNVVVTYEAHGESWVNLYGEAASIENGAATNIMPHYSEDKVLEMVDGPFQCSHDIDEFRVRLQAKMDAHKRGEG